MVRSCCCCCAAAAAAAAAAVATGWLTVVVVPVVVAGVVYAKRGSRTRNGMDVKPLLVSKPTRQVVVVFGKFKSETTLKVKQTKISVLCDRHTKNSR